ncbi:hypothetical protein ACFSQQ_09540 [Mesorhizobium kowhaii]|uniref:hypothetical protein n=1 Tax=Mesorhizobium kowhaii TaxID=1300272 RepID=UPI0035EA5206
MPMICGILVQTEEQQLGASMKTYALALVICFDTLLLPTPSLAETLPFVLGTAKPAPIEAGATSPADDDWQTELPVQRYDPEIKGGGVYGFAEAILKGLVTAIGLFPESPLARSEPTKLLEKAADLYDSADKFAGSLEEGIGPNQSADQVSLIKREARRLRGLGPNNLFDPGRTFSLDWQGVLSGTKDERNTAIDGVLTAMKNTRSTLYILREQRHSLRLQASFDRKMSERANAIGEKMTEIGLSKTTSFLSHLLVGLKMTHVGLDDMPALRDALSDREQAAEAAMQKATEILKDRSQDLEKLDAEYRAAERIHENRTRSEYAEEHPKAARLLEDVAGLQAAQSRQDDEAVKELEQSFEADVKTLMSSDDAGPVEDTSPKAPETLEIGGQKFEPITKAEREKDPDGYKKCENMYVWKPGTNTIVADTYVDRGGKQFYYEKVEPHDGGDHSNLGTVLVDTELLNDGQDPNAEQPPAEEPASKTPNPCNTGELPPEECEPERPLWTDDTRAGGMCMQVQKTEELVSWKDTSSDCHLWRALYKTASVDCPEDTVPSGGRCLDPVEAACLENPVMSACQHPPAIDPLTGCPRGQVMDFLLQTCRNPGPSPCDGLSSVAEQRACVAQNEGIDCPEGTELRDGHCVDPAGTYCDNAGATDIRCLPERLGVCTLSLSQGPCQPPIEQQPGPPDEPFPGVGEVLTPPEAKAILAVDPAMVPDFPAEHVGQLDLQAAAQGLAPTNAAAIPDFQGSAIRGVASIGFIGRADSDGSDLKLVGMERADGSRIVVTDTTTLNAFDTPMTDPDFKVIASVSLHEEVFALVKASQKGENAKSSLRRVRPGSVETLLALDPKEEPLDITFFPGGDLALLVRKYGDFERWPELLRVSQEGKVVWRKLYNSTLLGPDGDSLSAEGLVSGAGADFVLLVGTARSAPWIMKVDGSGFPVWEKSYLYDSVSGEFEDGAARSDGFALVGKIHMREEDQPEALVARVSEDGTLSWMRGCGGRAFDEAVGAAFVADGGLLVVGATKSKELAAQANDETRSWVMSLDSNGWLAWETGLGLGGAAAAAWENGVAYAATDRSTVGSFALRPTFGGRELNWDGPEVYKFVPHQNNNPAMLAEGVATCFDVVARVGLWAVNESDLAETLRDSRIRGN